MIGPRARVAIAAAFFAYVVLIRTYDITNTFLMLGEQTRDWTIALGGWRDIPLTGTPSTAGGRGFGPVYYWILWLGRHLVGPFTSNLPHAGGITVALLQSAADTFLLVALWRHVPFLLALTMTLLLASAPFDISLSAVIWNPPVSEALVKIATALALGLREKPKRWQLVATTGVAWLAVQAHSSAVCVAAPLVAALVMQPLITRGLDKPEGLSPRADWRRAGAAAAITIGVVAILQVPYIVSQLREPEAAMGPTAVFDGMTRAVSVDPIKSYTAVVNTTGELLMHKRDQWKFQIPTLLAALVVLVRWRRDVPLLAVSVGPFITGTILFATWTRPYDSYWFLTVMPAMVLTFGMAVAALPWPIAAQGAGVAMLGYTMWQQPSRIEESKGFFKYPQYATMLKGSRELIRVAPALRDIRINFAGAHPTMDKYFIYRILGGRIEPSAPIAFIDEGGHVRVE